LALRRKEIPGEIKPEATDARVVEDSTQRFVKVDNADEPGHCASNITEKQETSDRKKPRNLSLEEYESALDQDTAFNDIDLDFKEPGLS